MTPHSKNLARLWMAAVFGLVTPYAGAAGGLFVTGHDPDFHALAGANAAGASNIVQKGLDFTLDGVPNNGLPATGSVLLVTSRISPPGGHVDSVSGVSAALSGTGFSLTVASAAPTGSDLDLATVNFSSFNAVIVASDFGGLLTQAELDILNTRSTTLLNYIDGGGAVVAFAESGNGAGLTTSGRWGWLPFLVVSTPDNQSEVGFNVTPFGVSMGLSNGDINGNASHNVFDSVAGMQVVDIDAQNRIMSAAFYGQIKNIPEAQTWAMLVIGLGMLGWQAARRRG